MWQVRERYPDIMLVSSEMCCGFSPFNKDDWQNDARYYLGELFHDINCGAEAFIDWNMLLDYTGGPSYCKNNVKSPVILNEKGDDFILSPIYVALKKFAKIFPAGSEVLRCEFAERGVVAIAREEGEGCVVVVANITPDEREVTVHCGEKEKTVTLQATEIKSICF
jgi:glucosylceramidase